MEKSVKHSFSKNWPQRIDIQSNVCSISCYIINTRNPSKALCKLWLSLCNWWQVHEN